jgi:hypothetical protein
MPNPKRLFLVFLTAILWCGLSVASYGQETKSHRWTFYGGLGPNYYFNNLEIAKNVVTEVNYSFVARLMWEPDYRLSLGFETGYNRLYSINETGAILGKVEIANAVIPIQLVVSMKFWDNFYGSFNVGQGILLNRVSTSNFGNFDANVVSLGDFALTFGYRRDINDRWRIGAELKGYYSTKLDDKNVALVFMGGYRLW